MIEISPAAAKILLIGVMPFLYGAATRLPFMYFVIHLDGHFELSMPTIGLCVALYQGSRVVTSALAIPFPRFSHLIGTIVGLAGYITVYVSDNDLVYPFVAGTAIVGFAETMSSMQKYAKEIYALEPDRGYANLQFKYQYASVMIGEVFAFSIGGFVYKYYNINGVALFGMIVQSLASVTCIIFLSFAPKTNEIVPSPVNVEENDEENDKDNNEEKNEEKKNKNAEDVALRRMSTSTRSLTSLINEADANFSTDETIPVTWINWVMCLSFGIEALTIGYNLSIGPIFMLDEFNKDTGIIGIMFAVGAASGTVAAIGVTCTSTGRKCLKKIADSPYDICFAMAGIGTGVLVAAVPNFPGHVIGLIILMCFNDLGATLMTELQASITTTSNYSLVGPLGQVVRRSLNVITALTGPPLFGILPRLPYFVAGGITIVWTIGLYFAFKFRFKTTVKAISRATGCSRGSVQERVDFTLSESIHSLSKSGRGQKEEGN